jgi:hypothetical protein
VKTVTVAIDIDAPPDAVWAVLSDLAAYPQWNPLFPKASGNLTAGQRITLTSRPSVGRAMRIRPKVLVAEPGAELRWALSLPGIIGGEHSFTLTPAGDGTHLVQSETFRGLLVRFSKTIAAAETDYAALNQAIKQRAEHPSALAALPDRSGQRSARRTDLADHGVDAGLPGLLVGEDILLAQAGGDQLRVQVAADPAGAAVARLLLRRRAAGPGFPREAERGEHFGFVRRGTRQDRDRQAVLR